MIKRYIIHGTGPLMHQTKWQSLLHKHIPLSAGFISRLAPESEWRYSRAADTRFAFRVPPAFEQKINYDDPSDPLLKQVLPVTAEDEDHPGFTEDPLEESSQQPVPGLLHKYHGRALLVVTGACAIHCRYCFRRHFPYADFNPAVNKWQEAIDYLNNDRSITEIILSGGDPLTLSDSRLLKLIQLLNRIPHLKRIRIHTRVPVVLPERINCGFIQLLNENGLPIIIVVHANHARELGEDVGSAIAKIRSTGTHVLNQSVLLRDINDSVKALQELSERLFEIGVMPYYLHMLDPVAGTAHFTVSEHRAGKLMKKLSAVLPGYLVPRLVREIPGEKSKLPVEIQSLHQL